MVLLLLEILTMVIANSTETFGLVFSLEFLYGRNCGDRLNSWQIFTFCILIVYGDK